MVDGSEGAGRLLGRRWKCRSIAGALALYSDAGRAKRPLQQPAADRRLHPAAEPSACHRHAPGYHPQSVAVFPLQRGSSTGEVQEIPLYYVANGVRLPVDLVAQSHGQLLVRIFSAMRTTPAIGMYGEPFSSYEQTDRLGLIAPEDFLAGLPRYQEIETSYHWFIN